MGEQISIQHQSAFQVNAYLLALVLPFLLENGAFAIIPLDEYAV